jgi:putative transport protein
MGVVISRIMRAGEQHVASDDQILAEGDIVHAVGPRDRLARLLRLLGAEAKVDLREMASNDIRWERVVVTRPAVLGKTLADLDLREQYEVVVTRATRAGYDLVTGPTFRLQFGDILTVVGDPRAIAAVGEIIGNRLRALQDTQMVPVFAGIALGVVIVTIPFALPGLPVPVKLGLAAGPLLTAIALARIGHIGPAVWYMPPAANRMMREFGISLFLAVVGLQSGAGFVDTLVNGNGLAVMACGAIVTLVPLLTVGLAGLWLTRANYLSICGILAGSMTDPPALAFAQSMSGSEAPTLSYATVYPIVMVLRVVIPQFIALALWTV